MKKYALVVLLLVFVAGNLHANGLGVYGTYWKTENADEEAYGAGVKVRLDILPLISLEGRGNFFPEFEYSNVLEVEVKNFESALLLRIPAENMTVYGGGGIGYYLFEGTGKGAIPDPDIDDQVGVFAVGGLTLQMGGVLSLFAEAKYTLVDVDIDSAWERAQEQTNDGDLDGLGLSVGIMLDW